MPELIRELPEIERRVLGVLIEKALTQSSAYPLTLNALVAGCNQKSNRDPEMDLDESSVFDAVESLRQAGLVSRVLPPPGSRSDRFKHEATQHYNWQTPQRAVMCELLLRGPQTMGELRTRAGRMHPFKTLDEVAQVVESLAQWDPPMVAALPRQPGQSAIRYMHLLYPESEKTAILQANPGSSAMPAPTPRADLPQPAASSAGSAPQPRGAAPAASEVEALREEIDALHGEIADLHEALAEVRRDVEALQRRIE